MQELQGRFNSKPPKLVEENTNSKGKGKKKMKELKVLDAKAAQNLSVILGTHIFVLYAVPFMFRWHLKAHKLC